MLRYIIALVCLCVFTAPTYAGEVLIVVWKKQATKSEKNFMKDLKALRPNVKYKIITANRNKSTLASKLRELDLSKIDLVYAAGTSSTTLVNTFLKNRKPLVFNYVSDPIRSKIIKSEEAPGANVTGVQFLVKTDLQLEIMSKVKKMKTMAVWFDPREKHNKILLKRVKKKLQDLGIEMVATRVIPDAKNGDEMLTKAAEEAKKVDGVYIISSYSYFVRRKQIFSKFDPKVFTVSSMSQYPSVGATMAIAPDFDERSKTLAAKANQILDGKKAENIPVSPVSKKEAILFINKERSKAAGLTELDKVGFPVKFVQQK